MRFRVKKQTEMSDYWPRVFLTDCFSLKLSVNRLNRVQIEEALNGKIENDDSTTKTLLRNSSRSTSVDEITSSNGTDDRFDVTIRAKTLQTIENIGISSNMNAIQDHNQDSLNQSNEDTLSSSSSEGNLGISDCESSDLDEFSGFTSSQDDDESVDGNGFESITTNHIDEEEEEDDNGGYARYAALLESPENESPRNKSPENESADTNTAVICNGVAPINDYTQSNGVVGHNDHTEHNGETSEKHSFAQNGYGHSPNSST